MKALIACKDCGHEISKKAKLCPSCGAPVRKGVGCLGVVLAFFFVGAFIFFLSNENPAPPSKSQAQIDPGKAAPPSESQAQIDPGKAAVCRDIDFSILDESLFHRAEGGWRQVYVRSAWYALPVEQKESIARAVATCRSGAGWVDFYDMYSGKKLASYSNTWGYSPED